MNSNSQIKWNVKQTNIAILLSFEDFKKEAQSKLIPSTERCNNESTCRFLNEVLYIAYLRLSKLKSIDKDFTKTYISNIKPNLKEGQVSKILIAAPELNKQIDGRIKGAVLFK